MKWRALLTLATTDLPPVLEQSHTRQPFVKACEPAKMTCAFMSRGANYEKLRTQYYLGRAKYWS